MKNKGGFLERRESPLETRRLLQIRPFYSFDQLHNAYACFFQVIVEKSTTFVSYDVYSFRFNMFHNVLKMCLNYFSTLKFTILPILPHTKQHPKLSTNFFLLYSFIFSFHPLFYTLTFTLSICLL